MYGTIRPDIIRVAEQTVVNLKELETRIEVLKNDLAALCVQVGHPEAARLAATPVQWLGSTNLSGLSAQASLGALGSINPFAVQSPFGLAPFAQTPFSPFSQVPFGLAPFAQTPFSPFSQVPFGLAPFAAPTPNLMGSPFGISPFALSPFAAYGAYPGAPVTQTTLPFNQGTPLVFR